MAVVVAALTLPGIEREPEHAHGSLPAGTYRARLQVALNAARRSRDLVAVERGPRLDRAAQDYAVELANRGELEHGDWLGRLKGIPGDWFGEIIQRGRVRPERAIRKFLASPTHAAVIANGRYARDGVGAARVGRTWYVVVDFAG